MAAPIDLRASSHILFRVLTTFAEKHNTYENLITELLKYIDTIPGAKGTPTLEVKLTTLIGNSDPSNPQGEAQRFLNTYFSKMSADDRKTYFKINYFGSNVEYDALINTLRVLDDSLRLRLTYTNVFIVLSITNKNASGTYSPLYHISISRDPGYDAAGQYGIPTGPPVRKSIHLTDETTGKHYFVKYPSFSSPLNEDAATLLAALKPGRWGGRKTIHRKLSKRPKKRGTLKRGVRR